MAKKPRLVQVGENFVDPTDVAAIVKAGRKRGLYIIRLKSQPNAEYPFWCTEAQMSTLMDQFDIVAAEGEGDE